MGGVNASQPTAAPQRWAALDAARGVAIVAMVVYHFGFDLATFRLIDADPYRSPLWIACRTAILSSFLLLSGHAFALAAARARTPRRFWRRFAQLAGCAALVSAGSWLMFPRSFIYFGVLHALAAMWLLAWWLELARRPAALLAAGGLLLIVLDRLVAHPVFDSAALNWVGFATRKPVTEDYVPLVPWFGLFLIGLASASWAPLRRALQGAGASPGEGAGFAALAWLGRHSLAVYMLHQPMLIGGLLGWQALQR
jgi:uncharacterized membrane protein